MDLLADLTPAQRAAVTHVDGPLLVLAGAGSGKTRVITRRVAHLLAQGIAGESVLALTFTNKAAGEMRQRIEALAPEAGVWVGTFHSLCARLLRTYAPLLGYDRGFTILDQPDRLRTLKDVLARLELEDSSLSPETAESAISRAKNDMVSPDAFGRTSDHPDAVLIGRVYRAYQQRLLAQSSMDFDDLLGLVVRLLKEHPGVRATLDARFRFVLVDEYQDTNLAQYGIVRALSVDHPNLCVTGDPDQSIYGWRGANINNILEFEHDFPSCRVVKLERNYRSTKNILKAADHLIRYNRKRKAKALTTENPTGSPVRVTTYATEAEEAAGITARIASLVNRGEYRLSDVAVFVRMTALTRGFEAALRAASLPYQVVGGVSFYERQEVKDVMAYLRLMVNPKDDVAFARIVNVPPRGLGKTSLELLTERARAQDVPFLEMARRAAEVAGLKDKAVRALREFVGLIDDLTSIRQGRAEDVVRTAITRSGYHKALEDDRTGGGEDRLANLDEFVSDAREFDRNHPGASVVDFLEEVSLTSTIDRYREDAGSVTLMTLHAAKGLEFPVVFVVALEEGILPHKRATATESTDELEEERRLLFVGITRARRELYLSHCRVREFRGQRQATIPSSFLRELPEDGVEYEDRGNSAGFAAHGSRPHYTPRLSSTPSAGATTGTRAPTSGFRLMTAAELAGASSGVPADVAEFRPGVVVNHPQYGLGRIVAVEGAGPMRKGRVAFTVGGERTFILAKSPLKPVRGS